MFKPERDDARRYFCETWKKARAGLPLDGMESMIATIIQAHPEYQPWLENTEKSLMEEWLPENGETNPFLHLSMHLAIEEQLAINQPKGIRSYYEKLATQLGDEHRAQHEILDCLAEMLWQSQRNQAPPDAEIYLACLEKKLGKLQNYR
ncbi:MAG: DUF1841 family protein [Proteobacteria bacterium]|nr:DUF1841 family protein [Pseudomonadota bacterium]MDE3207490.1 DUF1841 family protein [Pseudomonadota bacterium]